MYPYERLVWKKIKIKSWPALTATIRQGNLGNIQEGSGKESQKNKNGYKYHGCGSNYYFLRDCPEKSETSGSNGSGGGGGGGGGGVQL